MSLRIYFCRSQQMIFAEYVSLGYTHVPRVGNFRQKNNSTEDGIDGTKGYFRRNSGYSAEQKISEFCSEPFRGRENNSEFRSVDQKKSMLSEFPSEPFSGRENNSEFRSVDPWRADSRNSVPNHSAEEKTTRNKTRQRQSLTLSVFKLRVLVEAVRNGRDVAECG